MFGETMELDLNKNNLRRLKKHDNFLSELRMSVQRENSEFSQESEMLIVLSKKVHPSNYLHPIFKSRKSIDKSK